MLRIVLLILFSLLLFTAYSQKPEKSSNSTIEDLIEEIAANSDEEELDYTTLFDNLNYFINNPLNINNTSKEELEKLQILSDFQINNLLQYTKDYGNILSIYELLLIDGYNKNIIEKILPFITLEIKQKDYFAIKNALKYGNHQVFIRGQEIIEEQKGFAISDSALKENLNSGYIGSKYKIYTRYKYHYKNKLLWGITAEKDAGEAFLKNSVADTVQQFLGKNLKNGFDFYSAHLQINDVGIFKKIVVGDYQIQFGQGLTAWSGMSYGKSPYAINIKKKAQGLRKYSSTDENLFMRGIGTTIRIKDFDISVFASRKKIDANITLLDTISEEVITVSSFQATGLHSTPNELSDKDAITDSIVGGNITFNKKNYKLGLTILQYGFSAEQAKAISPYNQFEFSGNSNYNIGFDYQFSYRNINFFGESAISENHAKAFVNGAVVYLHSQMSLAVLHRHYERDYQSYYANAFAEGSKTANEDGVYIGTEIFPVKRWKLSAYFDNYKFPWLKFRTDAPSSGFDYFVQADYSASRKVKMYWKLKQEIKPQNSSEETSPISNLEDVNLLKFRYHIAYTVSNTIKCKNRIELTNYKKESVNDKGYMIYQDVIYKPEKLPLSFAFRYAIFDTDSWDTRIYAYENDLLYAFSIPAYYSKGSRAYLMLKYSIINNIDIWVKYSITNYVDKEIIGSGLTEINGNTKSEFKVQFRFKF